MCVYVVHEHKGDPVSVPGGLSLRMIAASVDMVWGGFVHCILARCLNQHGKSGKVKLFFRCLHQLGKDLFFLHFRVTK